MDDTRISVPTQAVQDAGSVIRRFSPVRIERLLLTRLFELAGGHALPDRDQDQFRSVATEPQLEAQRLGRKEAA